MTHIMTTRTTTITMTTITGTSGRGRGDGEQRLPSRQLALWRMSAPAPAPRAPAAATARVAGLEHLRRAWSRTHGGSVASGRKAVRVSVGGRRRSSSLGPGPPRIYRRRRQRGHGGTPTCCPLAAGKYRFALVMQCRARPSSPTSSTGVVTIAPRWAAQRWLTTAQSLARARRQGAGQLGFLRCVSHRVLASIVLRTSIWTWYG
ncbi:hypothetical protein GGR56DRAFT_660687 [Xylariaceae sp. FL0804]|nr:hypothetical protein GGR56DRAFT_660687 [Xylariaceae sp. FL0804]